VMQCAYKLMRCMKIASMCHDREQDLVGFPARTDNGVRSTPRPVSSLYAEMCRRVAI
jgi:hypothetical protein